MSQPSSVYYLVYYLKLSQDVNHLTISADSQGEKKHLTTQEAETGGPNVQALPGVHSE